MSNISVAVKQVVMRAWQRLMPRVMQKVKLRDVLRQLLNC